jgi:hypothetical protein
VWRRMQALYAANATGLAPPVFHGNWRQAAAARLRWFDTAGGPNGARTDAWCGARSRRTVSACVHQCAFGHSCQQNGSVGSVYPCVTEGPS